MFASHQSNCYVSSWLQSIVTKQQQQQTNIYFWKKNVSSDWRRLIEMYKSSTARMMMTFDVQPTCWYIVRYGDVASQQWLRIRWLPRWRCHRSSSKNHPRHAVNIHYNEPGLKTSNIQIGNASNSDWEETKSSSVNNLSQYEQQITIYHENLVLGKNCEITTQRGMLRNTLNCSK